MNEQNEYIETWKEKLLRLVGVPLAAFGYGIFIWWVMP